MKQFLVITVGGDWHKVIAETEEAAKAQIDAEIASVDVLQTIAAVATGTSQRQFDRQYWANKKQREKDAAAELRHEQRILGELPSTDQTFPAP